MFSLPNVDNLMQKVSQTGSSSKDYGSTVEDVWI